MTGEELWQAHLDREARRYREARMAGAWLGRQRTPVTAKPDPHAPLSLHHAMMDANEVERGAHWFAHGRISEAVSVPEGVE